MSRLQELKNKVDVIFELAEKYTDSIHLDVIEFVFKIAELVKIKIHDAENIESKLEELFEEIKAFLNDAKDQHNKRIGKE